MDDSIKAEKMQQILNDISKNALPIYNMLQPGTSITIAIHQPRAIISNEPLEKGYLIITKPIIFANFEVAPTSSKK
jgi:hypothetical protein